ncbi:HAMP domain-containing sensor histidine kinase [Rhizobium sp. MC63]|uniref:HAMP domain-containing sensor histidine kinase n=1 Tax=Rhizobium mulingense TaxID=3031128 RepID=A0ACC6MTS0_9HYPH|nr:MULTISPECIES: HAMP domain-containing sensor histidine kinase [unclassified Rhizobium]MDF0697060.1 HAMP domain-containing sensor histidine kinase [Rhizobium sp. MC63]MEA3516726.1 HAMP domain-containing sensor histidine kinase [Rhizobium sp. MJ31]MEB3042420.1 HAMP domain-containing sensor histidine kinase [Rhizobium sp. MJ21]
MRLAKLRRSTPFRLAVTFGVLFVATFIFSGAIMYHMLRAGLDRDLEQSLHEMNSLIASAYQPHDTEDLINALDNYASFQSTSDGLYSLMDAGGRKLAGNFAAPRIPNGVYTVTSGDVGLKGHERYRMQVSAIGPYTLVVAENFNDVDEMLRIVLVSFEWAAAIAVATAIGGGVFLAFRAQARLDRVANTMNDVAHGALQARIPITGNGDDLDTVAIQINAALERLQTLVESMRQVSADIAHDLKTPLNRLRLTLDAAVARNDRQLDVSALLDEARSESDRINATFAALLRISQIEAGARKERFQATDIDDVLAVISEVYTDVAEDAGRSLSIAERCSALVWGDRDLLTQMIANLVENAINHCPAGTAITLSLRRQDNRAILAVADSGPGIPAEEREKVFRRLYRLDKSRTTEGSGLGLSLVRAVADLHSAEIAMGDNHPGLTVSIGFPLLPAPLSSPASAAPQA